MKSHPANSVVFTWGFASLFIALLCQNVTLADGDYRGVLLVSLFCSIVAAISFAAAFVRGSFGWKIASLAAMLPVVFIVSDFCRRAPFVFGDH